MSSTTSRGWTCIVRGALAMAPCVRSQLVEHANPIQLTPPPANVFQGQTYAYQHLSDYKFTMGDLNGDGVPDLVFSNALAYVAVYFLKYTNPQARDDLTVAPNGYVEIMPFNPPPATNPPISGPDGRYLSQEPWGIDTAVIYDIDPDGKNELIYLEHAPAAGPQGEDTVGIQIYKWDGFQFQRILGTPVVGVTNMLKGFSAEYLPPYAKPKKDAHSSLYLRLVNVRGRAMPQDVMVFTGGDRRCCGVQVYKFESGGASGSATLSLMFSEGGDNSVVNAYVGHPGHSWRSCDIDFDGTEEVIGKHVAKWLPDGSGGGTKQRLWGMVFKKATQPDKKASNAHPDSVAALDFLDGYTAEDGQVIPAPGIEVLCAPQADAPYATKNTIDPSGPWVYRSITGHTLQDPPTGRRQWPRKMLSLVQSGDALHYEFPSSQTLGWQ